jgi:copper(I)-binding protein
MLRTETVRRPVLLLSFMLALAGCSKTPPEPTKLEVKDVWVRLSPVAGRPAAAYFTLKGGSQPERLTTVTSSKAVRIELHEGGMSGNMMTMKPIAGAFVPANTEVKFAPGGNHAMVFDLDPAITPGTRLPIAFSFQSGLTVETEAKTVAAGDSDGHEGH